MKKLFTKHLFRAFTLLTLMLTTTLVANAAYWLRGDHTTDQTTGWTVGTKMTDFTDGSNKVYVDITVNGTFYFKIYNDASDIQNESDRWWGYTREDQYGTASSLPWTFYEVNGGSNAKNMIFTATGDVRITLDPTNHKVDVLPHCPVDVASGIQSTVVADKTEAFAGEKVTLTVTPAEGFWADNTCIKAYATITPGKKEDTPDFGEQLTIVGDAIASHSEPGTYTFTMPDAPKGAYVQTVDFKACTPLDAEMFNNLPDYAWTGGPIVPTVSPKSDSGLTSDDYVVSYGESIEEGNYTVTVTGKGKYTGTVTLPYSIVKVPHNIIISDQIQNGQVEARPNPAPVGKEITLTATPNSGYELGSYTVTPAEGDPITVTETDGIYTFIMPNCDVTVFATFTKIPQLRIACKVGEAEWQNPVEMIQQADGSWVITKEVTAELAFSFYDQDDHYYGSESQGHYYDIDNTNLNTPLQLGTHDPFYIKQAGTWTITVNAGLTTVTVTGDWKYNVETTVVGEGTLVANPTTAAAGNTIELTVTYDNTLYNEPTIVVTYGDNQTLTPTPKSGEENIYEFMMPASDVTVTATFAKIPKLFLSTPPAADDPDQENWDLEPFVKQNDGTWVLVKRTADALGFGMIDENKVWYGSTRTDNHWFDITANMVTPTPQALTLGTGERFYLPVAGDWTFTVNADRTTITISGPWDYAITVNAEGCTVTTTVNDEPVERASAMETVTVTVTPTVENSTGVITVVDADGNPVEFNATNNTFVMPYSAVTITATYTVQKFAITLGTSPDYTLTTDQTDNSQVAVGAEVTVTVTPTNTADFVPAGLITDPALQSTITDNGDGTYTFTMPANAISIEAKLEAILHGVVFDANHRWATYYGAYNLEAPENVEVYTVGADYALGEEVPVTKIDYIPANVGVLLYCPNDMADITTPLYTGQTSTYTSALVGSVEPMTLAAYENYVLYNDVFLLAQAGTLPAHRCYLPKPADGSKMRLTLNRPGEGGVITAIEGIDAENVANVKYVNLAGMTSDKPFSGINIMVITRTDGTVETMKIVK